MPGFNLRQAQVSLRQDGLDYFDTHHTADDTLDKIDPKQLDQAVEPQTALRFTPSTRIQSVDR
jgi:carboxypeptidase Q